MDRARLSFIAHSAHHVACPLGRDSVDRLVGSLALRPGDRVVDFGCGRAEWLLRIVERHPGTKAVGVDVSADALGWARERVSERELHGRVELVEGDANELASELPRDFALALCVGSTHAFGGLGAALDAAVARVRTGGQVLVGDGFWARPPTPEALSALGMDAEAQPRDLAAFVELALERGLRPRRVVESSSREWDEYEWSWIDSLQEHARAEPAERAELLAAAVAHRDAYLNGYRGVLGFATMLARRAA